MTRVDEVGTYQYAEVISKLVQLGWLRWNKVPLGVGCIYNPLSMEGFDEFNIGEFFPYGYYTFPTRLGVYIDLLGKKISYSVEVESRWGRIDDQYVPEASFESVLQDILSGRIGARKAVPFRRNGMVRERKVWSLRKPLFDEKWFEEIHEASVLRVYKAWNQKGYKPLQPGDHLMCLRKEVRGSYDPFLEYWWISKDVADALVKIRSEEVAAKVMLELENNYSMNLTAADVKSLVKKAA